MQTPGKTSLLELLTACRFEVLSYGATMWATPPGRLTQERVPYTVVVECRRFGVRDRFNRELGAKVYLWCDPAHGLMWRAQATREGCDYGASQTRHVANTYAQRDAALEVYFAGARKRAQATARSEARKAARIAAAQADARLV